MNQVSGVASAFSESFKQAAVVYPLLDLSIVILSLVSSCTPLTQRWLIYDLHQKAPKLGGRDLLTSRNYRPMMGIPLKVRTHALGAITFRYWKNPQPAEPSRQTSFYGLSKSWKPQERAACSTNGQPHVCIRTLEPSAAKTWI